jgi:hypothetical protein
MKRETIRKAIIVSAEDKGVEVDGFGTIDSNPGRTSYKVETLNCTKEEFFLWLHFSQYAQDFCIVEDSIIDIGGPESLHIGQEIEVSYSDFYEFSINREFEWLKNELTDIATNYINNLQLGSSTATAKKNFLPF